MYSDIRYAFTQDGDEQSAPFCHLHLHKPILVGTEMTQNIQFRMVLNLGGRKKRPAHGSANFEKELQKIRDDNNRVMREFRCKVDCILDPLPLRLTCDYVDTERGFCGELHLNEHAPFSTIFVFSYFTLVQLNHTPFTVVTLEEIEIVNLVEVGSEMEMFNMTIVFKNFELDVLQIKSIPSAKRISIKGSLHLADVKYYENKQDIPDWGSKLEEIRADPKEFIKNGGWNFLNVETAKNSDSSGDEYSIGSYSSESDSSVENLGNRNSLVSDFPCRFGKYSYKAPGQASDSDPREEENKQTTLIQKTWTMAERKQVMVSSDECDSDPEVKGKKAITQTKLSTVRRRRKLVMTEESGEEEYSGALKRLGVTFVFKLIVVVK
ncbi:FACT complex subunit SPT16-like [Papaver somniferum]|uniref:FACT complex subunit SPT16-like n=1 Tax=Papaver somniferum TaxID=3469 RepID=UPI000E6F4759|nr:FACT complex subunit SPT16-like [Papaver somniferum]XP_026418079.1 FACT complex subunit SPT16-like [Papaver somniferum]